MKRFLKLALAAALALAPFSSAYSAASLQTTHAFLCAPEPSVGATGPRRVVNTSSTATPQPSYVLNSAGCALFVGADVGFFLSQGYSYGPNIFTLQQTGITGATTVATVTTMTLPAYAYIVGMIVSETAGTAVSGGLNIGDAGSATRFASALAVGANATVAVTDAALTRTVVIAGVPTASTIQVAAVTAFGASTLNITVLYSYF